MHAAELQVRKKCKMGQRRLNIGLELLPRSRNGPKMNHSQLCIWQKKSRTKAVADTKCFHVALTAKVCGQVQVQLPRTPSSSSVPQDTCQEQASVVEILAGSVLTRGRGDPFSEARFPLPSGQRGGFVDSL